MRSASLLTLTLALTLPVLPGCPREEGGTDTGSSIDTGPMTDTPRTGDTGPVDTGGIDAGMPTDTPETVDAGMDGGMTLLTDGGSDDGGGADGGGVDGGGGSDGGGTCAATDLGSALGDVTSGSSAGATSSGDPTCSFANPDIGDVAFTWTAPADGDYTFDTNGSDYDTVVDLFDGCRGASLDCDDDGGSDSDSLVTATLVAGQQVTIVIDGYSRTGMYALHIQTPVVEECTNGMDDDRDGDADCNDFDCDADPACTETVCDDGMDNDGDGSTDCADGDCGSFPACDESIQCTDGIDNDEDGDTDCVDFDCDGDPACIETDCHDLRDNDDDGRSDCSDSDCEDADPTCVEVDCTNFADDDGDGYADCDDGDCTSGCSEYTCDDGLDDDADGLTDCADSQCTCDPACYTPPAISCPDLDLGSALGEGVQSGTISAFSCGARVDTCSFGIGEGDEVEMTWTAPADGDYQFDTFRGSTFDTTLSLRTSCEDPDGELDCSDDDRGRLSAITATLTAGQTVIIVLDSYYPGSGGNWTLNITQL